MLEALEASMYISEGVEVVWEGGGVMEVGREEEKEVITCRDT